MRRDIPPAAFISYAHEDQLMANCLKISLEYYGLCAFLAQEDIEAGASWRRAIIAV